MPTVTFTIASATDDGGESRAGSSWPPTGAYTTEDAASNAAYVTQGVSSDYVSMVALFRWDTSSIPEDATIVSASFNPWCHNRGVGDGNPWAVVGDYYDFGGEPSVSGDWILECSPSIFTARLISTIPSGDVRETFPLTDISGINKSGYTGIRCSLDCTANSPGVSTTSFCEFKTYENASFHPADLEVTYVVGTPVTFPITSAADDGSIWRGGSSWPPTGSYTTDDVFVAYAAKGSFYANVALFRWDTSSIPDDATITEAEFRPVVESHDDNDSSVYNLVGDYYDFGGEPSDSSDWTLECSPSIFDPVDLFFIPSAGTQMSIPLTDLTGINISGYTGIRCSLDNPIPPPGPLNNNSAVFRTYDNAWYYSAQLFVAYTVPGTTVSFPIATSSDHGSGSKQGASWYPTAMPSTEDGSSGYLVVGKSQSDQYYADDTLLRWDTSSIPDGATITSARLVFSVLEKGDPGGFSLVGDYYDYGGNPVVAGDVIETSSPSIFTALDLGSIALDALNSVVLTDLTGINTSGYTGIRLTLSAVTPVFSDNYIHIAPLQVIEPEPRLEVTYTEAVDTPEFVGVGTEGQFGTGGAPNVAADTPSGISTGDTIFFVLHIADAVTGSVTYPGAITQVGDWVTGVADSFPTPALGLFRATWDGSTSSYTFTFNGDLEPDRGGIITTFGYTGDCTHRQVVTGTDADNEFPRDSPTLVGATGNLVFAAMGGSAASVNCAWSGGFTERHEFENYGINTGADAPSGASVIATVDPDGNTQSMWILAEIGPVEVEEAGIGPFILVPPFIR